MLEDLKNVLSKHFEEVGLNEETLMLSQFIDTFIVQEQKKMVSNYVGPSN